MPQDQIRELIKISCGGTNVHVCGKIENGKAGINLYISGKPDQPAENFAPILQAIEKSGMLPYTIRRQTVPGAPDGEKTNGQIIRVYNSKPEHDQNEVLARVVAVMNHLATVGPRPDPLRDVAAGADVMDALMNRREEDPIYFPTLGRKETQDAVIDSIRGFYQGLDGGMGVRKPNSVPPTKPGPVRFAEALPKPEGQWAGDVAPVSSKTAAAIAQKNQTTPPKR